ncbi:MAG: hypothetical protein A3D96_02020 [Chlamydiae bacterium RIFCSPHIGHO2_12_FULL_44_59]|nr:MAG: hypothetical protein A2796_04710 [Chlamydiae bacterium RIFCSPHIGHO2_01_FULL_44_39]OGN60685.1 MAG: hypothetical protein A3D96_02020 [Chlamydiae bacterium RIFCSPHIGHO2_12_FULL_44_59]OGN66945.1 MAG: hypothetical protein A2978_02250 [Chlamydiae bacterium RIFCSPLOWO2_01_FULL_44_52]OGN67496.1 MAG: hypothetical protein A3I67_03465 [Chlamydiae bacterium RIFCSPLOWO2_02_FULL_45_22]OGN71198.1 MAG: hypothetical protein A3F79_02490 [Chlamydiae bacterium RIFCSPLOWO2_12_FULL_45_20]
MEGKPVSASAIIDRFISSEMASQGSLLHVIDCLALQVAKKHSGQECVTLGIDSVRFFNPARCGDTLIYKASVNRVWDTSMEIGVKIVAEDFRSLDHKDILSAYFTFIAVDEELNPIEVTPVIPETPDQCMRFEAAERRRQTRLFLV